MLHLQLSVLRIYNEVLLHLPTEVVHHEGRCWLYITSCNCLKSTLTSRNRSRSSTSCLGWNVRLKKICLVKVSFNKQGNAQNGNSYGYKERWLQNVNGLKQKDREKPLFKKKERKQWKEIKKEKNQKSNTQPHTSTTPLNQKIPVNQASKPKLKPKNPHKEIGANNKKH